MFNPMMAGMMGGMMGGMMMPMMRPTPGVVPGMPGTGFYNSLPGRFGRDILGRDFAGPGGVGSSQPYRPPDPSALPPMPFGLPFIARPGQEGFDQYGRMLPPELPEGWDGWGRPIVAAGTQPVAQQPMPVAPPMAEGPIPPAMTLGTRDQPFGTIPATDPTSTTPTSSTGTGRPDQPACFDRPPAGQDSYFRYEGFDAFSLPARGLNRSWELHLPRELVGHDVSEEDWIRFINDLTKEAITNARHDFHGRNKGILGLGPSPILSEGVHSLLASWAVAFFAPRGIRVYAAQDGRRVIPPPIEPSSSRRGYSRADEWSDVESDDEEGSDTLDDEEGEARRADMYLPRREREIRRNERARMRRRERRRREVADERRRGGRGDWEVHFISATPTLWTPGARPRTYGEPVVRARR